MVDHILLQKKLSIIDEYSQKLEENKKNITEKHLIDDFNLRMAVAYSLQNIIQACIDICTHLASDQKWELPDNYAHAFKIALRHKVISQKTCKEFENAVKLRNVIVHQYDELDEKILVYVVQKRLSVFLKFRLEILAWLRKKS